VSDMVWLAAALPVEAISPGGCSLFP
jgi:hypothetical protein